MSFHVDKLRDRLREFLPADMPVEGVRPLAGGHSNETWIVEGIDAILRLPPKGVPLIDGWDVIVQAKLLEAIGRHSSVPVPQILTICEDAAVLGEPFFLMERIAGQAIDDYAPGAWLTEPGDGFRDNLSRNYIGGLAQIHTTAPLGLLGEPVSPLAELERWKRFAVIAGNDRLVSLVDQLAVIPAPSSGAPTLVHGDYKPANTMWQGCELAAVLDWEMAYNGEPLSDLGYVLFFFPHDLHPPQPSCDLPGMWGREQILSAWSEMTGRSTEGVEWYEAAATVKLAAILSHGLHLARTGQSEDARMAAWRPVVDYSTELVAQLIGRCSGSV